MQDEAINHLQLLEDAISNNDEIKERYTQKIINIINKQIEDITRELGGKENERNK